MGDRSLAEIEADNTRTQHELATTVAALGQKLDVVSRVKESAGQPVQSARQHWPVLVGVASVSALIAFAVVWRRNS